MLLAVVVRANGEVRSWRLKRPITNSQAHFRVTHNLDLVKFILIEFGRSTVFKCLPDTGKINFGHTAYRKDVGSLRHLRRAILKDLNRLGTIKGDV